MVRRQRGFRHACGKYARELAYAAKVVKLIDACSKKSALIVAKGT